VPYDNYVKLLEQAEMMEDVRDYDQVKAALENGDEEVVPATVLDTLLKNENTAKVWREWRGLSQHQVADKAGISATYLSQIESGKRSGAMRVLSSIARVLSVTLDDLAAEHDLDGE
jgi:DNA-binding XRE family transcriptional regulator